MLNTINFKLVGCSKRMQIEILKKTTTLERVQTKPYYSIFFEHHLKFGLQSTVVTHS